MAVGLPVIGGGTGHDRNVGTGASGSTTALVDLDGRLLARRRISDDAAGLAHLLELLCEHGDSPTDPAPAAIETRAGC